VNLLKIATRVASSPLSERYDYGDNDHHNVTGVVRKTPDKDEWCVKSENNPDWSGGCYESKEKAEDRLRQVEYFKSQK